MYGEKRKQNVVASNCLPMEGRLHHDCDVAEPVPLKGP